MKKWRIAQHHPEDRYEVADDVADGIRTEIRQVQKELDTAKPSELNKLSIQLKTLRVSLAERLYGK